MNGPFAQEVLPLTPAPFEAKRFAEGTYVSPQLQALQRRNERAAANRAAYAAPPPPPSTSTTTTTPAPTLPLWQQMQQKHAANSLSMSDALAARKAGDDALATAITRAIAGLGWSYTPTTTIPTTPPPPPPAGPQVIVYPEDAWKNNPTLQWFNGGGNPNLMGQLSNQDSYDPATGVRIQAERNINANTFSQLEDDPVREGFMRSVYARANRDFDKERNAVMAQGPRGIATAYTRTG